MMILALIFFFTLSTPNSGQVIKKQVTGLLKHCKSNLSLIRAAVLLQGIQFYPLNLQIESCSVKSKMVVRTFTINFVDLECKFSMQLLQSDMPFSLCSVSWGHSSISLSFESICLPFILAKATFSLFLGFQKLYSICLDNRDYNFHLLSKNISLFFSLLALLLPLGRLPPEKMLSACFTDFYTQHN